MGVELDIEPHLGFLFSGICLWVALTSKRMRRRVFRMGERLSMAGKSALFWLEICLAKIGVRC